MWRQSFVFVVALALSVNAISEYKFLDYLKKVFFGAFVN